MIVKNSKLMIIYSIMQSKMKVNFKKRFGQNFLINNKYAGNLVKAVHIAESDILLEIGPGHGAVTELLLGRCKKVIVIEIDEDFINFLTSRFQSYISSSQLEIIHKDILVLDISEVVEKRDYKVIGSLPYNISKKIIKKFFETNHKPSFISFILQKEVAENYTAVPPRATFLSNYAKVFSKATFIKTVPKESFKPRPKVDGGIITFQMQNIQVKNYRKFISFLKSAFMMPRKKLVNNLSGIYRLDKDVLRRGFKKNGIDEDARASVLEFQQWIDLYKFIKSNNKR